MAGSNTSDPSQPLAQPSDTPAPITMHALPPAPPLPSHYQAVAVLPPLRIACDEMTAFHLIEELLLEQIDSLPGLRSVSPSDVQASLLPLELDALGCERDLQCLARAGRYARAHVALATTVSGQGGSLRITLRLLQTDPPLELGRYGEILSDDPTVQREQLLHLLIRLFLKDSFVGDIALDSEPSGATIFWNDTLMGQAPLVLEHQPAGLHVVKFQQDGFEPIYRFVEVRYGKKTTFQVHLNNDGMSDVLQVDKAFQGDNAVFVFYDPNQTVMSEPWQIEFDGTAMGQLPMDRPVTHLPAGLHRITLKHQDHAPIYLDVTLSDEQRTDLILIKNDLDQWEVHAWAKVPPSSPLPGSKQAGHTNTASKLNQSAYQASWRLWLGLPLVTGGLTGLGLGIASSARIINLEQQGQQLVERSRRETLLLDESNLINQNLASLYQRSRVEQRFQQWSYIAGGVLTALGVGLLTWEMVQANQEQPTQAQPTQVALQPSTTTSPPRCSLPLFSFTALQPIEAAMVWGCTY